MDAIITRKLFFLNSFIGFDFQKETTVALNTTIREPKRASANGTQSSMRGTPLC